jgi:hypothetical protein
MGDVVRLNSAYDIQHIIETELTFLESRLKTNKSFFMYPTILSKYRKGINPLKAINNFLQESIIKVGTEEFNSHHQWCIENFKTAEFTGHATICIDHDITIFKNILSKYEHTLSCETNSQLNKRINTLLNIKECLLSVN